MTTIPKSSNESVAVLRLLKSNLVFNAKPQDVQNEPESAANVVPMAGNTCASFPIATNVLEEEDFAFNTVVVPVAKCPLVRKPFKPEVCAMPIAGLLLRPSTQ